MEQQCSDFFDCGIRELFYSDPTSISISTTISTITSNATTVLNFTSPGTPCINFDCIVSDNKELQLKEPVTATIAFIDGIYIMKNEDLGITSMASVTESSEMNSPLFGRNTEKRTIAN